MVRNNIEFCSHEIAQLKTLRGKKSENTTNHYLKRTKDTAHGYANMTNFRNLNNVMEMD